MPGHNDADEDRRRNTRFNCGGQVKISRLPCDGVFLPGTIRDLSLGGCWIDTTLPIDRGARTEIVVRVNAASFRVVGEVREIRGSGAGIEFVHLSAGGKEMLADLVTDLIRLQEVMSKLKSGHREMDAESYRREVADGGFQAAMLSRGFPLVGATMKADGPGSDPAAPDGENGIVKAPPLVIAVNLFG
jgi:PilZ domain